MTIDSMISLHPVYCIELPRAKVSCPMAAVGFSAMERRCFTSWDAVHSVNTPSWLPSPSARSELKFMIMLTKIVKHTAIKTFA